MFIWSVIFFEYSDLGAAMMEGLILQAGPSAYMQSAYQSEAHLSAGVGLQEEGGANKRSAYCKDLLMRGGEELSFEELRAERYNQRKQREMEEKLKRLTEEEEKLIQELEEKKRLLELRRSQPELPHRASSQSSDSGEAPAAASFHIYDESQSAAARPPGNPEPSTDELPDDVFLHPGERGLCLKIQHPPRPDHQGATSDDTSPPTFSQKPDSKTRKKLSPIQETSVIASQEGLSTETCSPLEEKPEEQEEEMDHTASPAAAAVDPCDPDVRRRLLDLSDVTSSPDLHSELRPLPAVEEHNCVQLGGEVYLIDSRVVDGGSFSIFKGAVDDNDVLLKVDSCSVPWDFHQFTRLKKSSSAADSLPLISCFLFLDGCITVYTTPPDHMFTGLTDCDPGELSVGYKAISLLQLVSQLHSCRLLHAALQPSLLTCCHTGILMSDRVLPVDWSSSVDLDLQQDVTSVQQLPAAQTYISLGLLEPTSPPQLVDLVGVAETVHLLLTNRKMVLVKDACGWTAEHFSGDEFCHMYTRMWSTFFRSLLNAEGQSSLSVLSKLKEQLSSLYY